MAYMDIGNLYQKYGLEQTVPMAGGEYTMPGETREIEFKLTLTDLTSTPTVIKGMDNVNMPAGFTIESIETVVEVAAATGVSIDIGLQRVDRSTEIDYNGLIAAETLANLSGANVGVKKTFVKGTSLAGALVGTTVGSNPGYFTANSTATLFTAGVVLVRVKYRKV